MAAIPDKPCLPQPGAAETEGQTRSAQAETEHQRGAVASDYPSDLVQNYRQLCERFQRTTNALASAAHDLKTPLAILNGYVELLQSEKLGPLNERQRDVIGELRMRYEPGDINTCLSEVCRMWSVRFQEKGLALYFLANDKLPEFSFDSPKVQRVISNLLENASKFTPSGGTVWLHAEPYMWERRSPTTAPMPGERRRQNNPL